MRVSTEKLAPSWDGGGVEGERMEMKVGIPSVYNQLCLWRSQSEEEKKPHGADVQET